MLVCEEVKELLSAYMDGELGEAASREVEEHLAACSECQQILKDIKGVSDAFRTVAFPEVDSAFAKSLSERLEAETEKQKGPRKATILIRLRPYMAAAACLVVAAGIYAATMRGDTKHNVPDKQDTTISTAASFGNKAENVIGSDKVFKKDTAEQAKNQSPAPTITPEIKDKNDNIEQGLNPAPVITNSPDADEGVVKPDIEDTPIPNYGDKEPEGEAPQQPITETNSPSPVPTATASISEPSRPQSGSGAGGGGGGGSASVRYDITVRFKLTDGSKREVVENILSQYASVEHTHSVISASVLEANFNACVSMLRGVDGLVEIGAEKKEGSGEHGYIVIEL